MKYALGNMLNGAGGLNPDGLSLDLQFATDKTLTARKGPTPVFTRGTSATQVGASGLIEYAPENLTLQSEDFGTGWNASGGTITTNVDTSPDGTLTADRIQMANAGQTPFRSFTFLAGTTYTFSCFVKRNGATNNIFRLGKFQTTNSFSANFTATSEWQRFSFTFVGDGSTSFPSIQFSTGSAGASADILVWGAQLERFSSARTYIPTTTAAVYAARFDHDPLTPFACRGLLMEELRVNQCYNSNLLTSASWSSSNASIATSDTAPDGSPAFEITETAVTGDHSIANSGGATTTPSTSITSGVTYTLSVFAKKSTGSVDWIQLTGTGVQFGTAQYANFDLATGAIGSYAGVTSGTIPKMEQFQNGWYRCSMTLTAIATGLGDAIPIHLINNTNTTTRAPSYLGSTANKVKVAMAQFEAGSFATSYIPTTSSALTRSADVCSITGVSFTGMHNQAEGSFLVNAFTSADGNRTVVASDDNTGSEVFRLRTEGVNTIFRVADGSTNLVAIVSGTVIANTAFKLAGAYKVNDFASVINGGTVKTDFAGTIPTVDRMRIGADQSGSTMCGCVSSLRYYRKRLSDAKIKALTAP